MRIKKIIIPALVSLIFLLCGAVNYLLFQPRMGLIQQLNIPIQHVRISDPYLRIFMTCYFSDICWCAALCLAVLALSRAQNLRRPVKITMLLVPFMAETCQYFNIIYGTFDLWDLVVYGVTVLLMIVLFPTIITKT